MNSREVTGNCRVDWENPYRAGTICNHVDDLGQCYQTDPDRCPCGGIVRTPAFGKKSDRVIEIPLYRDYRKITRAGIVFFVAVICIGLITLVIDAIKFYYAFSLAEQILIFSVIGLIVFVAIDQILQICAVDK